MKFETEYITENSIYWQDIQTLAKQSFPKEEYMDPKDLVLMSKKESFDFMAIIDNNKLIGFYAVMISHHYCYLFFLAIYKEYQSKGYGSQVLQYINDYYEPNRQVVDFEIIDDTAQNNNQRKKRKAFYLKNGYKETGYGLSYLGVDYEIMCRNSFDIKEFMELMKDIEIKDFAPHYFSIIK